MSRPLICLFGDSLTSFSESTLTDKGFSARLERDYRNRADVLTFGFPGETTKSLSRGPFQKTVLSAIDASESGVLFVTIFLGANDACLKPQKSQEPGSRRRTYVLLEDYENYIRQYLIQILQHPKASKAKVILITPPPVAVPSSMDEIPMSEPVMLRVSSELENGLGHQTWKSKRKFAEKIVEIARDFEETRVAVLDFWKIITTYKCGNNREEFEQLDSMNRLPGSGMPGATEFGDDIFCDGLHLGSKGQEILAESLVTLLRTKWPELNHEDLPEIP